jgi:hypothetical protein
MKPLSLTSTTTFASWIVSLGLVACSGAELEPTDHAQSAAQSASVSQPLAAPVPARPLASADGPHAKRGGRGGPRSPEKLMDRFDANKNGSLEAAELPERMQARLADIDTSMDNLVSKDELAAHFKAKGVNRGKRHFERKDTNKDGLLDAAEVGPEHWSRLSVADSNADQKLTPEELRAAFEAGKIMRPEHRRGHEHASEQPTPAQ